MIFPFTVIICFITVLAIVVSVLVFGKSPHLRNTPINKLRLNILKCNHRLINWIRYLDISIFNNKLVYYSGWIVPLFYITVVSFCLYLFFTKVYRILPIDIQDNKIHSIYIGLTVVSVYLATYIAAFSDPGRITKHNVDEVNASFLNNELIFFKDKRCPTCETVKPARSKHCSVCNGCIMLFDHHCIWLNNCVGYYNYKWFLGFLLMNINLLAYGGYICFLALIDANDSQSSNYWKLITTTNDSNKTTGVLLILCVIFIIITSLFTGLHMRYLYLGVTTNECDKWSDIEYLISLGSLYQILGDKFNEKFVEEAVLKNHTTGKYETVFISLKDDLVLFSSDDNISIQKVKSMEHDLINIYDTGFINNLKQRVFNRRFH